MSFAVEFLAHVDGHTARFSATSFRYGGLNRERRPGAGHVEASLAGTRRLSA